MLSGLCDKTYYSDGRLKEKKSNIRFDTRNDAQIDTLFIEYDKIKMIGWVR